MPWSLLPLIPLGLLTGVLSGVLGIGGGLVFAPLLLWLGLNPHQALATSTLAIVPTAMGGTWAHWRSNSLPWREGTAIAAGAVVGASLFSHLGVALAGWQLLGLQSLLYAGLSLTLSPGRTNPAAEASPRPGIRLARVRRWASLGAVGLAAGLGAGLLGIGGGLVMVPLMVRCLAVPMHLAIRLSTLGVLSSASAAALTFLADGRALLPYGLVLGLSAAVGARWSAAHLDRLPASALGWALRLITGSLAVICAWRSLVLLMA